jgi:hypothetical protein
MEQLSFVLEWWNTETRVNPNKLDVTRKSITLKVYEEHATHLLFETHVKHYCLQLQLFIIINVVLKFQNLLVS